MNFRLTVILFNVIILLFLAFMVIIPFAVLGKELALTFWSHGWSLIPIIVAVLAGIDLYFILNGKIFLLLEREDWPALAQELENRIFQGKRYSARLVKLLVNSYLVLSDTASVTGLETRLAGLKPALVNANALAFGAAHILSGKAQNAAAFFTARESGAAQSAGVPRADQDWLSWYCGFALLLDRQCEGAKERFSLLAKNSQDGIITGLSAYFLSGTGGKFLQGEEETAREGKDRVMRLYKRRADWDKEVKRQGTGIHAAILSNYLKKTGDYLYDSISLQ